MKLDNIQPITEDQFWRLLDLYNLQTDHEVEALAENCLSETALEKLLFGAGRSNIVSIDVARRRRRSS